MKILRTLSLLAACLFAASVTSCVSDGLTEPGNDVVGKEIATLAEQASSVMETISDVKALKETADGHEAELNGIIRSLENHVSYLSSSSSWEDATLATLAEQKKLAAVVGPILAQTEAAGATKTTLNSLDANAKSWLGKNMGAYWSASLAEAQTNASLAVLRNMMRTLQLQVEGLASDVEAGLKKDEKPEELEALAKSVAENIEDAEELSAAVSALVSDLEETYRTAVQTASQDPASYDNKSVNAMNRTAALALAANDVTLQSLAERVDACNTRMDAIASRLGELEADMEELLNMIQSVTLMQDNSSEYAVAYYTLDSENFTSEGYMERDPLGTLELKYLIRPASVAEALTDAALWDEEIKVIGYYAQTITKASVETFEMNVTNVVEDADVPGLVTVTVNNAFNSADFYFKKIGAKVALSITAGKTDITSKFVEIVPKDASNTVYAESLVVTESVQIELNESVSLKAVLTPLGADQTLTWMSDNEDVVKVSGEGVLTATGVGTAMVTATSATTDEYGRHLTATCNVTVNPDIKIVGPKFVEEGYSINLRLDCPRNINPEQITWTVSNPSAITVQKTTVDGMNCAEVSGNAVAYNGGYEDITITCAIAGETTLTHTVQCVEVQPRDIDITGLTAEENENNEITLKFGQSRTLGASIVPNNVDAGKFTLAYGNSGEGLIRSNQTITAKDENDLKNGKVTGYFNVEVNSDWYWYDKTFQTIADKITRKITVNVEPYYITGFSIPASQNMVIDNVLNQLPDITFTSDVDGHAPSYTDLIWSSSASEYVSVNETTGRLTAHQLTTESVKITASIKNPEISVKPGVTVADAYCYVTVTEAAASDPQIGDYYFADGTFAKELPAGYNHSTSDNKVIGVIFSLVDATDETYGDAKLRVAYPACSHGLVISTIEYDSVFGYTATGTSTANPGEAYMKPNGYDFSNVSIPNGYSNTLGWNGFATSKGDTKYDGYYYAQMYRSDVGVPATHTKSVPPPTGASSWYIPSYCEIKAIHAIRNTLNEKFSAVSGDQISTAGYWTSSFPANTYGGVDYFKTFDMSTGEWGANTNEHKNSHPVRVVLAF